MHEVFDISQYSPIKKRPLLRYWPAKIVGELFEDRRGVCAKYHSLVWTVAPFFDISEKDLKCLRHAGPHGKKEWYVPIDLVRQPRIHTRMKEPPILHEEGLMPFGEVDLPWRKG